jgi:hypothetical protein
VSESFFVPDGPDVFVPTDHTIGPWDARSQHGGPPAALLGRSIESAPGGEDKHIARVTFDLLRPVPLDPLSVGCEVVRPARRVDLVEASLRTGDTLVMRASAWRIRTNSLDLPEPASDPVEGPENAASLEPFGSPATHTDDYYLAAMDIRFVEGVLLAGGPATAWFRARYPLVADEDNSPLTAVLIAIDSASGISAELDPRKWLFINPDLDVHLARYPTDGWVCIDARSQIEPRDRDGRRDDPRPLRRHRPELPEPPDRPPLAAGFLSRSVVL